MSLTQFEKPTLPMTSFRQKFFQLLRSILASTVWFLPETSLAQVIHVVNAPRAFNVVAPATWVPGPILTGNTRVALTSLKGSPHAECAVIAVEFKGQSLTQKEINQNTSELSSVKEMETEFGRSYNNVKIRFIGRGILAGHPAQVVSLEYSVGTPNGEMWGVMTVTSAAIAPNVAWSVSCGGLGKNLAEANKSFSYWQSDIINFPTNFKLK